MGLIDYSHAEFLQDFPAHWMNTLSDELTFLLVSITFLLSSMQPGPVLVLEVCHILPSLYSLLPRIIQVLDVLPVVAL